MKKLLILSGAFFLLLLVAFIVTAEIISFKVKKTTDEINKNLNDRFQQIVRIPEVIPPSYRGYSTTLYSWEMETPQKEISRVNFEHGTGFSPSQETIIASISAPQGADMSLFNKVLPAVVADSQALNSAQNQKEANLEKNEAIGYEKITLEPVEGDISKVKRIAWEFKRQNLSEENDALYASLYKYPESVIKFLFALQKFTIRLFSS